MVRDYLKELFRHILTLLRCSGSDIIHLSVAGTSIVVLNSRKAADDLLEKRSHKYSSRSVQPCFSSCSPSESNRFIVQPGRSQSWLMSC